MTMKKNLWIFLLLIFVSGISPAIAQSPFSKGVNLTGWFSYSNARSIPFTKFTKNDLQNIKSLGCDVIRLPITLHSMTGGAPDYVVDPIFFTYLDQVIDWTEELQLNLIIDNHTIPDATKNTVVTPLLKIWPQMAKHYKNRSTSVFYEILNEPNTMLASDWAAIQTRVVDSIRVYDDKHTIIVTGADWGGIAGLLSLKKLKDTNLIYSFHFYDPFLFTHQGASWTSPSMVDLASVPFPYNASKMPACPTSLKGSWVETSLNSSYQYDGTVAKLKSTINSAIQYANTNGVKIYCGEMGVYNLKSAELDRIEWYKAVAGYLTEKAVPWTMWDYQGSFGLFNKGSNELFEYDINRQMAEGMGFTLPPVKTYTLNADTVPFDIYSDFVGENIVQSGIGDLFSSDVYQGNFSILLTELKQYDNLEFKFKYIKDLSKLVAANYKLDFWVKSVSPGSSVVLRFVDTKTTVASDHPWRMDYTLSSSVVPFDGAWHHLQIPLKSFVDAGSYDLGVWYNSTNSFDWKAVERFQIVAESAALTGKKFWFDNIRIEGTPITTSVETAWKNYFQAKIYPNPVANATTIEYMLPATAAVDVSIYNLDGQKLITLESGMQLQGMHQIKWSPLQLAKGIYLCKISSNNKTEVLKLMLKGK
jgi:endoglucanase